MGPPPPWCATPLVVSRSSANRLCRTLCVLVLLIRIHSSNQNRRVLVYYYPVTHCIMVMLRCVRDCVSRHSFSSLIPSCVTRSTVAPRVHMPCVDSTRLSRAVSLRCLGTASASECSLGISVASVGCLGSVGVGAGGNHAKCPCCKRIFSQTPNPIVLQRACLSDIPALQGEMASAPGMPQGIVVLFAGRQTQHGAGQ